MKGTTFYRLSVLVIAIFVLLTGCKNIHSGSVLAAAKTEYIKPDSSQKAEYLALWQKMKALHQKGLPKTALKVVEKIFKKAGSNNHLGHYTKALIHKFRYMQQVEEETLIKVQKSLKDELKKADEPKKQVIHSLVGELYWTYYQRNRYRFLNRSALTKTDQLDMRTWDLKKIVNEVLSHYNQSLTNPVLLQSIEVNLLDEVIVKGNTHRKLRPTLYDFLAHRAVDFFKDSESGLTRPKDCFYLNNKKYLEDTQTFSELKIISPESESFKYLALRYLQDLTSFHLRDKDKSALIEVNLKRLKFIFNSGMIDNKSFLYEKSLNTLIKKYRDDPAVAEVFCNLAEFFNQQSAKAESGQKKYKFYRKKAYDICRDTIRQYPKTTGAKRCFSLLNSILKKELTISLNRVMPADLPSPALLKFRNIEKVYFKIFPVSTRDRHINYWLSQKQLTQKFLSKKPVKEWELNLPNTSDYLSHHTEISFPRLGFGKYIVIGSYKKDFNIKTSGLSYTFFDISNISYTYRKKPNDSVFYTAHRSTGEPLSGLKVQIYQRVYNTQTRKYNFKKKSLLETNDLGLIHITPYNSDLKYYYIEFIRGSDRLFLNNSYSNYKNIKPKKHYYKTIYFTDRKIYRPGQTLYFKGIMLNQNRQQGEKSSLRPHTNTTVILYDVNRQKTSSVKVKSNKWGTFSGKFVIPTGLLNGQMRIQSGHGSSYFSVEEYKRPKFQVTILPLEKQYKVNDVILVKAKALAFGGYNIDNAEVLYRVVRDVYYPYRWYRYWNPPVSSSLEILNGNCTTDERGEFKVKFTAVPDLSIDKKLQPAFRYTVFADVTDSNGETRSSSKIFNVGYTSLLLHLNIPSRLNKTVKSLKFSINSTNLDGEFLKADGNISVYRLKSVDRVLKNRIWRKKPDIFIIPKNDYLKDFPHDIYNEEDDFYNWGRKKVTTFTFNTGKSLQFSLKKTMKWKSGKYVVEMQSKDESGGLIKTAKYFTLYSNLDTNLPYKMFDWFHTSGNRFKPGETLELLIGTSLNSMKALFEIEHQGKITEQKMISLNNEQKKIKFLIKEKHRGNFSIRLTSIKGNRLKLHSQNIIVPWDNKNLKLKFLTFRNKLLPGEKEKWKIRIQGENSQKISAEMVATLYDASLDTFRPNYWSFNIFPYHYPQFFFSTNNHFGLSNTRNLGVWQKYSGYRTKTFDRLNLFGLYWGKNYFARHKSKSLARPQSVEDTESGVEPGVVGGVLREGESASPPEKLKSEASVSESRQSDNKKKDDDKSGGGKTEQNLLTKVKTRTNFNETAFFLPHLETDKNGEIIVSFTIPESITKWKMMGFAHTGDLKSGIITNHLVTQKDLMVVPNFPRFLREKDLIVLTSKITNLSDKELEGSSKLLLFDAATMKPVDTSFKNSASLKPFKVKAGQSTMVSWQIKIPQDISAVTYRVIAAARDFSDGEENTLPILKNRKLVTETMPLPVRSLQTKTFKFKKLIDSFKSTSLKHHKLTLEFTSNPAWYAVQALPYLMEFPYECLEQTFSRYYANSIAAFIVNKNPKIKQIFEVWKKTKSQNPFLSNLEKNQDLKSLMLQETPWVLNARNESERKRRVALLFDFARMDGELNRALRKIIDNQLSSGAWPWFKGMRESRYITQHIAGGFAHLQALKVLNVRKNRQISGMMNKSLKYLDRKIRDDYRYLLKHEIDLNKQNIGYLQIHYLYVRSYFTDIPIHSDCKKAFKYYFEQAQTYWPNFNRYLQGMMALSFYRYDQKSMAKSVMTSIKEHALHSEEMGMYFKDSYGYYWYNSAIESHSLLIEAFGEILNDQKSVDDLKTWLLKSKQTQDWGTTKATADACYALLLQGSNWLSESKLADITLGDIKIDPEKLDNTEVEAGTGYFKTSWSGGDILSKMGNVTVKNNNKVVAWGGLYWQYFEDLDKITRAKSPLNIKKDLYIQRPSDRGPVLVPFTKAKNIKPGDRIKVRIEIRVDRDMEFIHMKDMRASGFEPENVISRCKWQDGLCYYESTKDASTNFFFDYLPKGTYVFEYPMRITHKGDFSNGITTIQSMYAPEFAGHSKGIRVKIK